MMTSFDIITLGQTRIKRDTVIVENLILSIPDKLDEHFAPLTKHLMDLAQNFEDEQISNLAERSLEV